jgi:hypothetical protein
MENSDTIWIFTFIVASLVMLIIVIFNYMIGDDDE